ncbi:hypothetical protein [Cognatilysobacter bugurensis]|uniref:DUF2946 domain-containing protein n=1 Tax=Cognatilysobacter bugurensis TaxID=543356 RepID=A0A918WAT7_9GAMM|nr:hypothetical protein [Lysobacter bugurensis]GHA86902.1 hypothetical protein GCM10007067_25910 [Lysobacter bugurensis]
MKLRGFRHRRMALRIAVALLFTLLFQHAAIAAYACPLMGVPTPVEAAMPDCGGMETMDAPVLCEQHCNPDNSTTPDVRVAQPTPVLLPPLRFELTRTLASASSLQLYESVPVLWADPPPTLRFCSLLI